MATYQLKASFTTEYAGLPRTLNVSKWRRNYVTRKHLSTLTSAQLKDIGLSETQVKNELAKPFWK
ncbi:DUF1127 domain-containing protein [Reinekea thalattae]|nr:DUF1127 domain-containing protein [Reinekea thalattae]